MSKARDLADSAQEINILDGKSFLDEDNLASDSATGIASQQSIKAYVDGITTTNITSTGALNSGSITSGFGNIDNGSSTITTTGAITGGSFVIGSADINENDLESIDGITAGTVSASKAVVVNTNKDITGFRNITATGTISGTLSGSLSSTTTATTQAESDDSTKIATTEYVSNKITTLIGGAPSTLNDLNELAAAINDDANYNSTLTTALGTKLPKAGGTMTGNVLYNDNVKALFGAGADLQIYSDGNYSYLRESGGTSGLKITSDNQVSIRKHDDENIAVFNIDGAVRFYHDNAQKFSTTSTGIDVTGTVTSDGLTVDGNATFLGSQNTIRADDAFLRVEETDGTDIAYFGDVTGGGVGGSYLYNHGGTATVQMRADQASTVTHGINLNNTSIPRLTMTSSSGPYGFIEANTVGSVAISADGGNSGSNTNITFNIDDDEKVRLDTSGNLLVGKTSAAIGTAGHSINGLGYHYATRAMGSNGTDPVFVANILNNNGNAIEIYKDSSKIGGIQVRGNTLSIGSDDVGLEFHQNDDTVYPKNFSTNTVSHNSISLGGPNHRFKNGYFAGNLYGDGSNLTGVGGSTSLGAVGTYAYLKNDSGTTRTAGYLGSTSTGYQWGSGDATAQSGTSGTAGTWRCMGYAYVFKGTVWVRVS
tara:strand:- start:246 stop:2204 length:1959 start_codon:yes stop_codon:yes gene_type:complete